MIEQMLLRIARRGPPLSTISGEARDSSILRTGFDPSLPFPAKAATVHAPTTPASPSIDPLITWRIACSGLDPEPQPAPKQLPLAFAQYSEIHAEIGAIIWTERHRLGKRIVHVVDSAGLVLAAIHPKERKVFVRKTDSRSDLTRLSLRELPVTATMFDRDVERQFDQVTPHMLLWYCGQAMRRASEYVPKELITSRLMLRKLPLVDPKALDLRHLRLIHIFSAGVFTFAEVVSHLDREARKWIGADITSLYLTGSLVTADE